MIICNNNFLRTATITPNLPSDIYKASNLYSQTQYGIDGICQYTTSIVIDLGSAKNVTAIGVLNSSATITVEANTSDSWGSPAYSLNITQPIHLIDQTYRYWRIYTATAGAQYIGSFYLGVPLKPSFVTFGSIPTIENNSIASLSQNYRYFGTKGAHRKREAFVVEVATEAEAVSWYNWVMSDDIIEPFIYAHFEESQTTTPYQPFFARVSWSPQSRNQDFSYSYSFEIEEVK